jgi:hypothetical protein
MIEAVKAALARERRPLEDSPRAENWRWIWDAAVVLCGEHDEVWSDIA